MYKNIYKKYNKDKYVQNMCSENTRLRNSNVMHFEGIFLYSELFKQGCFDHTSSVIYLTNVYNRNNKLEIHPEVCVETTHLLTPKACKLCCQKMLFIFNF